jgi:two-component system cell cycle sensor histidine kinase/response regulator CckA
MDIPLEMVVDSLEDGILVLDESLRPVWFNRACGRLLGLERTTSPTAPTAPRDATPAAIERVLAQLGLAPGLPRAEEIKRLDLTTAASEVLPVEVVLTFGCLEERRIVIVSIRDISAQQEMERAVYDARKTQAIGALAGGIAHDFNNILTAVISQIDLVLYGGEIPQSLRQHLIYAQTSARRGAELVAKLQAFSRQSPAKFEVVDLAEVIEQALFMLRRSVNPLISIHAPQTAGRRWLVKADTNQLLQVILNIGINSRDAMPKGGSITLELSEKSFAGDTAKPPRRPGDFVCLSLADTGHGMTPEVLSRVFEPYFSTKDRSQGPGLALSIASSVIAEHAGWIEVTSKEGEGSCFSLLLPQCETPAAPKRVSPPESKPAEGRERILVVDDEELVRMVTKAVLAYRGYQISEAGDGEEAVQKYAEANPRYDLVLMDLHMPRLNGYDALQRIRAIDPKLKAVLVSGGAQDPASLGGEIEGVAYLQKPFDNQELASVVRRLLDA